MKKENGGTVYFNWLVTRGYYNHLIFTENILINNDMIYYFINIFFLIMSGEPKKKNVLQGGLSRRWTRDPGRS